MESFVSNENKSILWGVLQENNIFQGIDNTKFKDVKKIFEDIILKKKYDMKDSLIDLNKETVTELIKEINNFKNQPKISMVYKAADFQNNRREELNKKMKSQEEDMNKFLNPGVPEEISFKEVDVDKPLGENLERAIADMIASRERELDQVPQDKKAAEKWINNGNKIEDSKKNVTFEDDYIETTKKEIIPKQVEKDNFDIFTKLKKKSNEDETKSGIDNISNSHLYKELVEIKQTLKQLKELIETKNI